MAEPHSGIAGFTLLELLVTMALLGLLTMVMFASMRFGVQVWARTGSDLTAANTARKAEALLQAELSRAYPLYSNNGTTAQIAFDGGPHRISYLTPSQDVSGTMEAVVLDVVEDGAALALVRSAKPELARSNDIARKTLLTQLHAVAFSYFGVAQEGAKPSWTAEWRQRTRLPQLIRIAIEANDGSAQEFVVAPRLTADAGCMFDALTKSCRGR